MLIADSRTCKKSEGAAEKQAALRTRLPLAANIYLDFGPRARRRRDISGAVARYADIVVTMVPKAARLK